MQQQALAGKSKDEYNQVKVYLVGRQVYCGEHIQSRQMAGVSKADKVHGEKDILEVGEEVEVGVDKDPRRRRKKDLMSGELGVGYTS